MNFGTFFNFNGKGFTFLSAMLMFYLFYASYQKPMSTPDLKVSDEPVVAKYSLEVDLNKPRSELTLGERIVMFFFQSDIERAVNKKAQDEKSKMPIKDPNYILQKGDTIKVIIYKSNARAKNDTDPKTIVIGSQSLSPELTEAIMKMQPGAKYDINLKGELYHIEILELVSAPLPLERKEILKNQG